IVPALIGRGFPRPARVFPLRFGRQAEAPSLALAEPGAKRLAIVPGHIHHRMVIRLLPARFFPRILRLAPLEFVLRLIVSPTALAILFGLRPVIRLGDKPLELPDRHLVDPHMKAAGDLHLVLEFVVESTLLLLRRPDQKLAR